MGHNTCIIFKTLSEELIMVLGLLTKPKSLGQLSRICIIQFLTLAVPSVLMYDNVIC